MNIVLKPTTASKRSKNRLQDRFDTLRKKLLTQQKLNRKFQDQLDELVAIYQTQLAQIDSEQVESQTQLASKLINFYSRKSLSQWHREELIAWIMEILDRIGRVEPDTADELHGRIRQLVADQLGMTEAELDEEAQLYAEAMEEAFVSAGDTDAGAQTAFDADDLQEDMFGFDDIFAEQFADEDIKDNDRSGPDDQGTEIRRKRLMDGSWARDLFRRAAQVLHPDRESDPEQRKSKERAMQQLLDARSQGDVMTLLQLYGEHANDGDLVLAEQEMTSVCELLEEQLTVLIMEKANYIYQHPIRMQVHDLLYSASKKTREKRIKAWQEEMKAEEILTQNLVEEMRNLKVLKEVLEERRWSDPLAMWIQ